MNRINRLKLSIFSLFIAVFFALPAVNRPIQNQSASSPIYPVDTPSHQLAAAQDEPRGAPLYEELMKHTNHTHPQWNHNVMNIGQAWADGYTGAGIRIAILDTGFFNHPDLNMAGGNSVFPDDPWSNDHSGHGTHIAGIIGAASGTTYQGIAPGAELYGIKIYHEDDVDEEGYVSTNTQSVANGIQLAMDFDVDIIVISSGLTFHDEALYEQIQAAHNNGVMIIAASGNGSDSINYPAVYKEVIAVTALDERLFPAVDIIYGQQNDFAAPGVNIGGLSIPDSAYSYPYIYMSGSSQAAPHIAGMAAILMEKYGVRGEEARTLMEEQAVDIGDPHLYGHGLLRYLGDAEANSKPDETIAEEDGEEEDPASSAEFPLAEDEAPEEAPDDRAVRKPTSSRAADTEIEEGSLAYYQAEAVAEETTSILPVDTLSLVETGGTLEIWMDSFNSLTLSTNQINAIRERNITLVLAREEITWTIPPANFLLDDTILRFYEGPPVGLQIQPGHVLPVYTTAIYQDGVRRHAYPGQMDFRFDLSRYAIADQNTLQAYYWNREEEAWVEAESLLDGGSLIMQTRQASTVGVFDGEIIASLQAEDDGVNEEMAVGEEPETAEVKEAMSIERFTLISILGLLLLGGGVYFWRHRR